MSTLRSYFVARIGRTLTWGFEAGAARFGDAHRRDYAITVRGIDGDALVATVESHDFDRDGRRLTRVAREHGPVRVPMGGLSAPIEALEDAARAADPDHFSRSPRAPRGESASAAAGIEERLAALDTAEGRAAGEPPPNPGSVARFRRFWSESAGLALPDLFSSRDGTLRARWQDGHERTLWISFPEKGALGWTAQVPRQGGYGLRKMNARCADDRDIVPFAELIGIRCTR